MNSGSSNQDEEEIHICIKPVPPSKLPKRKSFKRVELPKVPIVFQY